MSIGTRIKQLRNKKELTQDELGNFINEKRANISSWETDRTKPEINSLKTLAEFFNVSVDYLLYGAEPSTDLLPGSEVLILADDGSGGHRLVDLTSLSLEEQKVILNIIETYKQKHQNR